MSPASGAEAPHTRNPWYLAPFFGREPALEPSALRIIGLVSLGMFFENYDIGLVNAVLPQLARELDIPAEQTARYLGLIRLGGIGAFLLLPLADRLGRRRIFLIAMVGMSCGTLATGLARTPIQFALLQMGTRVFMLTGATVALVILVEELPARDRGAGLGFLSILGGLGFGLSAGLYAVVESLPGGWRALYVLGVVPILLLPMFRRSLQETRRFQASEANRAGAPRVGILDAWAQPIRELRRGNPRRAALIGVAGLLAAVGMISFIQYTSYFVQNVHGWSPADYTLLVYLGGMLGLFGNVMGGRGSDRWGRRRVAPVALALAPAFVTLFFNGPAYLLVLAWGLGVFCTTAGELIIRALSAELFPTSHRVTAAAWLILVQTLGWSAGLFLVDLGTDSIDDLGATISRVALACLGAAVCLALLPETRSRELEAIDEAGG